MSRWTVYLWHDEKGWSWSQSQSPDKPTWGVYKTRGHAVSAAKRSIPQVVGGKTNPKDFTFIEVTK